MATTFKDLLATARQDTDSAETRIIEALPAMIEPARAVSATCWSALAEHGDHLVGPRSPSTVTTSHALHLRIGAAGESAR